MSIQSTPIKTWHNNAKNGLYKIIAEQNRVFQNGFFTMLNPLFCRQSWGLNWWPCTGSRGVSTSLFCRENDHRDDTTTLKVMQLVILKMGSRCSCFSIRLMPLHCSNCILLTLSPQISPNIFLQRREGRVESCEHGISHQGKNGNDCGHHRHIPIKRVIDGALLTALMASRMCARNACTDNIETKWHGEHWKNWLYYRHVTFHSGIPPNWLSFKSWFCYVSFK